MGCLVTSFTPSQAQVNKPYWQKHTKCIVNHEYDHNAGGQKVGEKYLHR
jgi:hypothetical protein